MTDDRAYDRQPHRGRAARGIAAAVVALGCLVAAASPAAAAGTSPVLLLASADVFPAPGGERLVTASGAFNFDDLVQVAFPAVGLMVVQGQRLVRFELGGAVVAASSPAVADGVAAAELPQLLALGEAAGPPARLAHVSRDRIAVVLPAELVAGPASVLLYAAHENEFFVSNAVAVTLP